jgi:hypothetical protein
LGSNVLRTETASIALLSMLIYHFMRWKPCLIFWWNLEVIT